MKPTNTISVRFSAVTRVARSVDAKALGRRLATTASPGAGIGGEAISAPGEPGANGPSGCPRCTMWMIGVLARAPGRAALRSHRAQDGGKRKCAVDILLLSIDHHDRGVAQPRRRHGRACDLQQG